jgi:hypothetical protein
MPAIAGMSLVLEEGQLLPALRQRLFATRRFLLRLTLGRLLLGFAFCRLFLSSFFLRLTFGRFLFGLFLRLTFSYFFLRLFLGFFLHFTFGRFLLGLLLGFPFCYFFLSSFFLRLTLGDFLLCLALSDLPFRCRFLRYFPLLSDFSLRSFFLTCFLLGSHTIFLRVGYPELSIYNSFEKSSKERDAVNEANGRHFFAFLRQAWPAIPKLENRESKFHFGRENFANFCSFK